MKYTVTGHATVVCSMVIEPNTEEEKMEHKIEMELNG